MALTMTYAISSLDELLTGDLDDITINLREELGRMAGKKLLITGGADSLVTTSVQAALHFNQTAGPGRELRSRFGIISRGERRHG